MAPTMATGIARAGTTVERQSCRNSRMVSTAMMMASRRLSVTSARDVVTNRVES